MSATGVSEAVSVSLPSSTAASPSADLRCLAGYVSQLFQDTSCWSTRVESRRALLRAVPAAVAPVPTPQCPEDKAPADELLAEQSALTQPDEEAAGGSGGGGGSSLLQIGRAFFKEAMARLQLKADAQSQIARVQALASGPEPLDKLEAEKARVKAELKRFDVSFEKRYARPPVREEKEPLRPCYMYYRRLKWEIRQQTEHSAEQRRGAQVDDAPLLTDNALASNDVELQLERLQHEKSIVRAAIQRFQEEFIKTHGRPIKYRKDVVKMENEYRQYKQLRDRIAKLEDGVRRRRALQASLRNPDSR